MEDVDSVKISVKEGSVLSPGGDDFCQDGKCDLLRALGAEIQSDRSVQSGKRRFRDAGPSKALDTGGVGFSAAQDTDVEGGAGESRNDRRVIDLGIVRENGHSGRWRQFKVGECLLRPGLDQPVDVGKSLFRRKHAPWIDDDRLIPDQPGQPGQGDRYVDPADDHQPIRWLQWIDEQLKRWAIFNHDPPRGRVGK